MSKSIRKLLKHYGLKPQKGLGQNFLSDHGVLQKIVNAAEIQPGDIVLEIGPGLGTLTTLLAGKAEKVIAVELDVKLVNALEEILAPHSNIDLIQGDILALNLNELFTQPGYLVVANIPYYITSALVRQILEARYAPQRIVLTVQKEVAQRICAEAGRLSLLALSVQVYGKPEIAAKIPAGAFYPAPNVDSAVVRIEIYPQPLIPQQHLDLFFTLTRAGFSQKRKTLHNSISAGMGWNKEKTGALLLAAGIDPKRRAQTLSIDEWGKLAEKTAGEV